MRRWGGAHQQVLHQGLHILGGIWGGRVVRRQLDERSEEVLAFLHVLLHLLSGTEERRVRQVIALLLFYVALQQSSERKRETVADL